VSWKSRVGEGQKEGEDMVVVVKRKSTYLLLMK